MPWEVEFTDEFGEWWDELGEPLQDEIAVHVGLLEAAGPQLGFPHTSAVRQSRHRVMRELRVQFRGEPFRILYAFDPRRTAILLVGGCKTGNDRWYEESVHVADRLYDAHLKALRAEGLSDDPEV